MIEQILHTVKVDFPIYLTFWDLNITNLVKKVSISQVGKSYGRKMMSGLLCIKGICSVSSKLDNL